MSVKESDLDFFYDFYGLKTSSDKIEFIVGRFARVAFGTASQFLVAVSIHKHLLMKMLIKILSRNS